MAKSSWSKTLSVVVGAGVFSLIVGLSAGERVRPVTRARVTVSTSTLESRVSPTALGVNTSMNDGNLYTSGVTARLKSLGVKLLRWPGGSFADTFAWSTEPFALEQFGGLLQQAKAQAVITVNYGSGTPAQAAAEVRFADVTHHYGIKYWEIGNEQYGDGEYQHNAWEENFRSKLGPAAYAKNSLKFIQAMRAADPAIKIGVVATIPGVWPSGLKPYWDRTMLPIVAKHINFVVLHWYPNDAPVSNSVLLRQPAAIGGYMATLKAYLQRFAGAYAKHIQIFVDETNNSSISNSQTISVANALFLAKDYNNWLKNGAANVSWWDLHTAQGNFTTSDPGFGLISAGLAGQPPLNGPLPPYFGFRLVHFLVAPGDSYVEAKSSQALLTSYAVKDPQGGLGLMLVNTSPTQSYRTSIAGVRGFDGATATVRLYGQGSKQIATSSIKWTGSVTSPPYSITEISISKKK